MNFESFKQEMASEQKVNMNYDNSMNTPAGAPYASGGYESAGMPMGMGCCGSDTMMGPCCGPIYECPRENVCHRYICYEVPHIMPCNTRIINHHVYRHTYRPEYTTCEENVISFFMDLNFFKKFINKKKELRNFRQYI